MTDIQLIKQMIHVRYMYIYICMHILRIAFGWSVLVEVGRRRHGQDGRHWKGSAERIAGQTPQDPSAEVLGHFGVVFFEYALQGQLFGRAEAPVLPCEPGS